MVLLKGIMIAFYFKETEIDDKNSNDFAIEFYHKSLQEYLTAEKIWNEFQNFINKDEKTILHIINNLFSKKMMTPEILNYIFEMIDDTNNSNKNILFQKLEISIGYFLEKDFVYSHEINEKSILDKSLHSFYGFWMIYSYLLPQQSYKKNSIGWIRRKFPLNINKSIFNKRKKLIPNKYKKSFTKVLKTFLSNYDLPLNLSGLDFSNSDLQGINLSHCNLDGAIFIKTNLSYANLNNTTIRDAILKDTNFTNSFIRTNFKNSRISDIDFAKANIRYANFYNITRENMTLSENQKLKVSFKESDSPSSHNFVDLLEEESNRSLINRRLWR